MNEQETRMKELEIFSNLQLPEGLFIMRLDGRGFSKLTKTFFEKPFDANLNYAMVETTKDLMDEFGATFGYTQSDEISILFPTTFTTFGRRLEKLLSIVPSSATNSFSRLSRAPVPAQFDCRIIVPKNEQDIKDYFYWRVTDAKRNSLNSLVYWSLIKEGKTEKQASKLLKGKKTQDKLEMLDKMSIAFESLASWKKSGTGIKAMCYERDGLNPLTGESTVCLRWELNVCEVSSNRSRLDKFLEGVLDLCYKNEL